MMAYLLVIDDDEMFRSMLRRALELEGYRVQEAADGRKGLALMQQAPADLVITDLIMPELEGLETIMRLRREFPGTPVIAVSGGGRLRPTDVLPTAQRLGAARVFAKPFGLDELLNAVRELNGPPGASGKGE
jgi:DNA-binding response OmpR family regulator